MAFSNLHCDRLKACELVQRLVDHHQQGNPLPRDTLHRALQECITKKDTVACRTLHSFIIFTDFHSTFSGLDDYLIRFFASHGYLLESNLAFLKTPRKSFYTWEAFISAHVNLSHHAKALTLFDCMCEDGIHPSKFVYLSVLRACGNVEEVHRGRLIHAEIVKSCLESDLTIESTLLNMYARCGGLEDAQKVFNEWSGNDIVMWNTMITAYSSQEHSVTALKLYETMEHKGLQPDKVTCLCLLKACANNRFSREAWLIHDTIIRRGFDSDMAISNTLVDMYSKCEGLDESQRVFDLSSQNVVTWNAKIAAYAQHGHNHLVLECYKKMRQQDVEPDKVTFLSVLKACGELELVEQGQQIHDEVLKCGLGSDAAITNALIHMYAKAGNLQLARNTFDSLSARDMVSWGAMISGYVENGRYIPAFKLACSMILEAIKPEKVVLLGLLKACAAMESLWDGQIIHHQMVEQEFEVAGAVGNTLIDMYAKCHSLDEACNVFDKLPDQDLVSWSAMISGHVQQGHIAVAFDLFSQMQRGGIKPDKVTYLCLLKASANLKSLSHGKKVHHAMIQSGLELDLIAGSALVDMYVKMGDMEQAHQVFDKMAIRNEVSWSVMIGGYVEEDQGLPALELFQKMIEAGLTPDKALMIGVSKACASVGAIGPGMFVHDQLIRHNETSDLVVGNTLLNLYATFGLIDEVCKLFHLLPTNRDGISWSIIIALHAKCGNFCQVSQALHEMKAENIRPLASTFTSILVACCQSGKVEEGRQNFKLMTEYYGIRPTIEHINCMVDLLGRAAHFEEVKEYIRTLCVSPDLTSWLSLLAACKTYKNVEFGRVCFDEAVRLEPNVAAAYLLMSKIYVDAHMWEEVHCLELLRHQFFPSEV